MSGHSHWATIKRKKGTNDQKRGQVFSKLAKAMSLAAKGNADPETNFKLRLLMDKARQANMPKENISRAIQKGSGQAGDDELEEVVYEGYGPEGVAIIVEVVTDNRNRTTAEIKNIFEKSGGSLASPGAVAFLFRQRGWLLLAKAGNSEEQMLKLIDLGVQDVDETPEGIEVLTTPAFLVQTKKDLEAAGFQLKQIELIYQPVTPIKLDDPQKIVNLFEALQDHDDVQKVFTSLG